MGTLHSETEAIKRAIGGDRAALDSLLALYYPRLTAHVAPKLPPDLQTSITEEDVLQDSFLEVYQHLGTCRATSGASFYQWILTIVDHRMLDLVRSVRAIKRGGEWNLLDVERSSAVAGLEQLAVSLRTPSMSAAGHEAIGAVQSALKGLPADYAEALKLRYIEGLSVGEAAARMNRSEGSVLMLCHRGLRQMASLMGSASRFFSTKA